MQQRARGRNGFRPARWRAAAAVVVMVVAATACGSDEGGVPTLTWWINPDPNPPADFEGAFGQAGIAERCSTDQYKIETELLPGSASEQRIQLARRLAAEDSSIDLMSLDPVFTAEFAEAEFLEPLPADLQERLSEGVLQGAIDGATWDGQLVVAPLWANTQVLWYRKSLAEAAGLDMTQPVTWDQIIQGMSDVGATVGVQANKYEGYVVWINALIEGAGGHILVGQGEDATVELDSDAGRDAAAHHRGARQLTRRTGRPLRLQRGHRARTVRRRSGRVHRQLDVRLQQLPRGPDLRRHRLGALPPDDRRRGVTATHRGHQRGRRCVQLAHRGGPRRGGVHHLRGTADHLRRRHGEHAGQVGCLRGSGAERAVPHRSARPLPGEHRRRRTAPAFAVLEHDRQRHPRRMAPRRRRQPRQLRRNPATSSRTSSTGKP